MTVQCHECSETELNGYTAVPNLEIIWLKSDYVDPPDTGGKIRTYNLLRQLNKYCRVTYISLQSNVDSFRGDAKVGWATRVETYPHTDEKKSGLRFALRVLAAMFSTKPYIVQKYRSPEIQECQRKILTSNTDPRATDNALVVCDFLEMTGNVDWQLKCPKVLFEHNVESIIWRRYFDNERNFLKKAYFWFEHRRMQRYERDACNRFDLVMAVSLQDKHVLQRLGVTVPIEIVETGVDTEYFTPQQSPPPVPGRLLFLGSLDWMPNIDGIDWFVRKVYQRIKDSCPHVSLDIVGRRPVDAVQTLVDGDASIRVFGSVPDVRSYLSEADVFVVPLRIGSGTRLKIFEAMAMQRPVVSTAVGAEGLPLVDGRHLLQADTPAEFANAVVSLLKNPVRKHTVAIAGYELVTENYSWSTVGAKLHEVCLRLHRQDDMKVCLS